MIFFPHILYILANVHILMETIHVEINLVFVINVYILDYI